MTNNETPKKDESLLPREVQFSAMPKKGQFMKISPTETETSALCDFYNLLGIVRFMAEVALSRKTTTKFHVKGRLKAKVMQPCVVSFKPVETEVDEEIDTLLIPASEMEHYMEKLDDDGSLVLDVEQDIPDIYQKDVYDVGALVLEYFAIGLNPYPQAENVELDKTKLDAEEKVSPFAGLAALKDKLQQN